MAKTVVMPQMGYDMDAGTLLRWLKQVGDPVERGEAIAEIETDKVNIEIEAFEGGVLRKTLITEGQTVPVGDPIAIIGDANEVLEDDDTAEAAPAPAASSDASAGGATAVAATQSSDEGAAAINAESPVAAAQVGAGQEGAGTQALVPQAQMETGGTALVPAPAPAGTGGVDQNPVQEQYQGSSANGQVVSREPGERIRASPLVRRMAEEHDIDLSQVQGTGPHGRIVKRDIEGMTTGAQPRPQAPVPAQPQATPAAAPAAAQATPAPAAAPQPAAEPVATPSAGGQLQELSRIRQTIGKRMSQSFQQAPHFYVSMSIEMDKAMALREQVNADLDKESQVSVNDLIVKASALALTKFPVLNSSFVDGKMELHDSIDVGVAVALDTGLISPFIPNADQKSLGAIARVTKDLVSRARSGGLKPEEFSGGTFTTSNLGMMGVDEFIAIINPPQASILAIGGIKHEPVWDVDAKRFNPKQVMKVTMSADHRLTDGAEVARCLQEIKRLLENPMSLLVG